MLNPGLYHRLESKFGDVKIVNAGMSAHGGSRIDPVTLRRRRGTLSGGEQYIVCCPFCRDSRFRLYISHLYGEVDDDTGGDHTNLAHCFNEQCLRDTDNRRDLAQSLHSMLEFWRPRPPVRASLVQSSAPQRVRQLDRVVDLGMLPPDHAALTYLRERGFDPAELSSQWGIGYCISERFAPMRGRIYIPIHLRGTLIGWQGRALSNEVEPKYFNMPGFRKSEALFNFDRARDQPVVVAVEGVTDAWRVGPAAVALFGKKASLQQCLLMTICSRSKPLLIALDGDAQEEAERLAAEMKTTPYYIRSVVVVRLPADRDPGSLERGEFWEIARAAATEQGVVLPDAIATPRLQQVISANVPEVPGMLASGNVDNISRLTHQSAINREQLT
jgi:hypothetical protein